MSTVFLLLLVPVFYSSRTNRWLCVCPCVVHNQMQVIPQWIETRCVSSTLRNFDRCLSVDAGGYYTCSFGFIISVDWCTEQCSTQMADYVAGIVAA